VLAAGAALPHQTRASTWQHGWKIIPQHFTASTSTPAYSSGTKAINKSFFYFFLNLLSSFFEADDPERSLLEH